MTTAENSPQPKTENFANTFDSVWREYLKFKEELLEIVYRKEIAPLLDKLFEGLKERRALRPVLEHWKETRLNSWKKVPYGEQSKVASNLHEIYLEYTANREESQIIVSIEEEWLILQLLRNVHGIKLKNLEKITPKKASKWIKKLGNGFDEAGNLETLIKESEFIETYLQ